MALIITEVTRFSEEKRERVRYQLRLKQYISRGGGVLGGHDIIYLRAHNHILEEVFGCRTVTYHRAKSAAIRYVVNENQRSHPICEQLPNAFELSDEEVTTGKWADVATVLYSTGGRPPIPLVTARSYGKGKVVWTNTGDSGEYPPKSLSDPEPNYVALLSAALEWLATPDEPSALKRTGQNEHETTVA